MGIEDFVRIAHTGLNRMYSLLSAHVFSVLKMPATCSSHITEHHSCSSTLLSVLLSKMGRVEHVSTYLPVVLRSSIISYSRGICKQCTSVTVGSILANIMGYTYLRPNIAVQGFSKVESSEVKFHNGR